MKKTMILMLVLILTLCGCKQNVEENLYEESNYDVVSAYVPSDTSAEQSTAESQSTEVEGEFTIKVKTYDFRGNNIAILNVKNGTNKNYTVTVKGSYLDESGNVLGTETQTLDQYSAGYEGYFFFEPEMAFADFQYEIETEESDGPFLAKDHRFRYAGLIEMKHNIWSLAQKEDFTKYPSVVADMRFEYTNESEASFWLTIVYFNAQGEIMAICDEVNRYDEPSYFEDELWCPFDLYQTTDQSWEYDGQWDDLSAICIVRGVVPDSDEVWWDILPKRRTPIEGSMQ
ncbi:MAG: hypothetical protein IJB88_06060 [Clostridia bacterium]|nr:hypothetical protein [Clostridia bacterium]